MEEMKVLNIYKLNIYQVLTVMFKIKTRYCATSFLKQFPRKSHRYPTGFSQSNSAEDNIPSNQTKFAVSSRGSRFGNRLLNQEKKTCHIIMALKTH